MLVSIRDLFLAHSEARRERETSPGNPHANAAQGFLTNIFLDLEEEVELPDNAANIIGPYLEKARSEKF